jgi:hypothetical protein
MEGTHQKGSNYYRCRFSAGRGNSAADAAGHPRALQIKDDTLFQALLGFMDYRLFGPERLKLLRNELAGGTNADEHRQTGELESPTAEESPHSQAALAILRRAVLEVHALTASAGGARRLRDGSGQVTGSPSRARTGGSERAAEVLRGALGVGLSQWSNVRRLSRC